MIVLYSGTHYSILESMATHYPAVQLAQFAHCQLGNFVNVDTYDYSSCYLWQDSPVYDAFGDVISHLKGDTIYLYRHSFSPIKDLFHEIGHVVGRKFDVTGHRENSYCGSWSRESLRHTGCMKRFCHWSYYLNCFALMNDEFEHNSGSELWAELFMLWFLYPQMQECVLIENQMQRLQSLLEIKCIQQFADAVNIRFPTQH